MLEMGPDKEVEYFSDSGLVSKRKRRAIVLMTIATIIITSITSARLSATALGHSLVDRYKASDLEERQEKLRQEARELFKFSKMHTEALKLMNNDIQELSEAVVQKLRTSKGSKQHSIKQWFR